MATLFLLGLYDTGLYTAQLCKKIRVPVYGFDHQKFHPGFYSTHISATYIQNPLSHPQELLQLLVQKAIAFDEKPALLASSELYLSFIHDNRAALEPHFLIVIPPERIMDKILSKAAQFELAESLNIDVPKYYLVNQLDDIQKTRNGPLPYPLIIKGNAQSKWKEAGLKKSYIVLNFQQLSEIVKLIVDHGATAIVQEIIEGPITNNYEYNALMLNGQIIESVLVRKIRQYPAIYGAAICVETCRNEQLEEVGRRFVLENKLEGFSNTEFKLSPNDGKLYFIETNARVWLQIKLTNSIGQNFLLSLFSQLYPELNLTKKPLRFKKIKWVDPFGDLMYLKRIDCSLKGFSSVFLSYYNAKSFGLLNLSDIKPFRKSLIDVFKNR